jgi:hypothetical protein
MRTHNELVKAILCKPGVKDEVERVEREEGQLLNTQLKIAQQVGLPQHERVPSIDIIPKH